MPPMQFREILVCVSGATPQVITETIQALAVRDVPVHLDEIRIITTAPGKKLIQHHLLEKGVLQQLCTEYVLPPLCLNDEYFTVIRDNFGNELNDLWTVEDNEAAANQIADVLRQLAGEPASRLHCSLAGGRKTMSYFMGLAFQMVARQWDRLYHVMVNPDFEGHPDFYYMPKNNSTITARFRDGSSKVLQTDDAQVHLIDLPLIYLRDKLSIQANGIREMVAEGQRTIDSSSVQLPVRVNLSDRTIYIGDCLIELPPTQLTIYTAFLRLKLNPCKFSSRDYCYDCISCFVPLVDMTERPFIENMADDYQQIYGGDSLKRDDLLDKWFDKLDSDSLRQQISKINKALKDELQDETMLPFYQISCNRKYAGSRYGVKVDRAKIIII